MAGQTKAPWTNSEFVFKFSNVSESSPGQKVVSSVSSAQHDEIMLDQGKIGLAASGRRNKVDLQRNASVMTSDHTFYT
jgi:hypothetical protein